MAHKLQKHMLFKEVLHERKIVIPLSKDRVAPYFGSFPKILVWIMQASVYQESGRYISGESPLDISRRLVSLGVEKVICGGIPLVYKEWLVGKGIINTRQQKRGGHGDYSRAV